MSTNELRVLDFVEGNQALYEADSAEILGRAVTARETIECIMYGTTEFDKNVYQSARQTVLKAYHALVEEDEQLPSWSELVSYLDADACEALMELADLYWFNHHDCRSEREEFINLLQHDEDKAQRYQDDCVASMADWILESEYTDPFFPGSTTMTTGILQLMLDLDFAFEVSRQDSDCCDVEDMPEHLTVTINDAQRVLFPAMVPDYATLLGNDSGDGQVRGVMRRADIKDALQIEEVVDS